MNKKTNMSILWIAILAVITVACSPQRAIAQPSAVRLSAVYPDAPLMRGALYNEAIQIRVYVPEGEEVSYRSIQFQLNDNAVKAVEKIDVLIRKDNERSFLKEARILASATSLSRSMSVPIEVSFKPVLCLGKSGLKKQRQYR